MKKLLNKRVLSIGIVALLVIAAGLLYATHHKRPTSTSANSYTKGEPAQTTSATHTQNQGDSSKSTGSNEQPGDQKSNVGGSDDQAAGPIKPYGDFVSNHHPSLSGTPTPNVLTSVCTTTPGATCEIIFTNGDVTKRLDDQQTDRGGSTYWNNWSLSSIGLTAGSWQVTARANLNGQVVTATDAQTLEVAQ